MNATYKDVRKGDRYTFLNNDSSFYTAQSGAIPGPNSDTFYIWAAFTGPTGHTNPRVKYLVSNPDEPCTILNRNPNEGDDVNETEANDAKLGLAHDWELRAKFNYTNEDGETRDRRLAVEDYDGMYVAGLSYDERGNVEGYRRFLIDRINGPVVIR